MYYKENLLSCPPLAEVDFSKSKIRRWMKRTNLLTFNSYGVLKMTSVAFPSCGVKPAKTQKKAPTNGAFSVLSINQQ